MKRNFKNYLFAAITLCVNFSIHAQQKVDTTVTKSDRMQILDILRVLVNKEIGIEAKFVVQSLQKSNSWVLIQVHPVNKNGANIDYKKTKYYASHKDQIEGGFFDDHVLALLELKKANWRIIEYEIGATDYPGQYWLEKHGIAKLFD